MDFSPLEITLFSAHHIKNVNYLSKMDVYAIVSVSGGTTKQKLRTPVHKNGGTNPKWNHSPLKFTLHDDALIENRLTLKIELVSDRTLGHTKIGEAVIPVNELLKNRGDDNMKITCMVSRPKGKEKFQQGTVSFGCKFGQKFKAHLLSEPGYGNRVTFTHPLGSGHIILHIINCNNGRVMMTTSGTEVNCWVDC